MIAIHFTYILKLLVTTVCVLAGAEIFMWARLFFYLNKQGKK